MRDSVAAVTIVEPASCVRGILSVPGDKSISHRYAILAALADGCSLVDGYAPGSDCATTLACLRGLGVEVVAQRSHATVAGLKVTIRGRGLGGLRQASKPLDAGNSGTTLRLLAGVLAACPFDTTITGDASLRRRPMQRIIEPLELMGARLETRTGSPPLIIRGNTLHGIDYAPTVASAQVKSAILLAGLHAHGPTHVRERTQTRDHIERALPLFGIAISQVGHKVSVIGHQPLHAVSVRVPGDFSSAAFFAAAAAALPGSNIEIQGVGLNPTRATFLDVLRRAGAHVTTEVTDSVGGEPFGTLRVQHGHRASVSVGPDEVPALIDELPVLAALGAHGGGLKVTGAAELRAKESDRITVLTAGLRRLGATVDERPDGFIIHAKRPLTGGTVDAGGDHRMAMALAIAALGATSQSVITGANVVDVSYPGFFAVLESIYG